MGRYLSSTPGFFENSSYNTPLGLSGPLEIDDDDPFYEILDCHKVTFIESKLADPLGRYE